MDSIFDDVQLSDCADGVLSFYGQKWEKLAVLFLTDYAPLENYNMKETMSEYKTETGTTENFDNYGNRETRKTADGSTVKAGKKVVSVTVDSNNHTITDTDGEHVENTTYSTTYDDMQTDRKTGKNENAGESVNENLHAEYNENIMTGAKHTTAKLITDAVYHDESTNHDYVPTFFAAHKGERAGNIGVTTSQQMAQAEIDLSKCYDFICMMITDIADFFNGGVYSDN